jgi:glycerol dehydrogenase-like iron-containing ADH family enzyme
MHVKCCVFLQRCVPGSHGLHGQAVAAAVVVESNLESGSAKRLDKETVILDVRDSQKKWISVIPCHAPMMKEVCI